jgi:hypothetical protein
MTPFITTQVARPTEKRLDLEGGYANTPPQPPPTTPPQPSSCRSRCHTGIMAFVATLIGFSYLAIQVSSLCFAVSGAVFLTEEYGDIPSCAGSYRGWGIAMTVLYGMSAINHSNRDSKSLTTGDLGDRAMARTFGCTMLIVAIFPGLVAGLGNRDVLQQSSDCSLASIPQLEAWTTWIVYWNTALCSGLLLVGGWCLVAS